MLDSRTTGLLALHGVVVLIVLPLYFVLLAILGVTFSDRFTYSLINFPLYLGGILAAGLIFFNFYRPLGASVARPDRARVFQVTNLQIFVLVLMLFGLIFATKDKAISRVLVGTYVVSSYGLLFLLNLLLPGMLSRVILKGNNLRTCLVIGSSKACQGLETWLEEKEVLGLDVIGLLTPDPETGNEQVTIDIPVLGEEKDLRDIIRQRGVNQVLLLETRKSKYWVQRILNVCEEEGCRMLIYNPWAEYFDYPLVSVKEGPHTFFTLGEEPLESPLNRLLKRTLDIAVSLPVVLFLLPPVTLLVWFMQKRQSPGPVLYSQARRGFNRREFVLYKFRSMHVNPPEADESIQATRDDPRIFTFGHFMRRTSIDELPQFWNVLRGDMSLVGPRPHLPQHDVIFARDVKIYPQRHFVKPGITGLAQCNGFRGEITDVEVLRRRVLYDLQHITDWSLWADLEILAKTALIVFRPPATAY